MDFETLLAFTVVVLLVAVDFISSALFARRVRKTFETHRSKMLQDIAAQTNRVDGLVRQYRDLVKKVKGEAALETRMTDLENYIYTDLAERIEEVDLSVSAILDDDEDEYEERPTQVMQTVPVVQAQMQDKYAAYKAARANGASPGEMKFQDPNVSRKGKRNG